MVISIHCHAKIDCWNIELSLDSSHPHGIPDDSASGTEMGLEDEYTSYSFIYSDFFHFTDNCSPCPYRSNQSIVDRKRHLRN